MEIFVACEITALSWTWLNSSRECLLGLHLLMQEPIGWILRRDVRKQEYDNRHTKQSNRFYIRSSS